MQHTHDHHAMLRQWIWRDFLNITLGVWLLASAFTFEHPDLTTFRSDILTGAVIVFFGILTLFPRLDLARWGLCAAGIWLLFAPLIFWTPSAAVYGNDTLVGSLVIGFSVLIPMMPSRAHHDVMMLPGPDTPPGWSYNPSDWIQRGPIIAMAFVGFFLSRYLASYQLDHIPYPWDPFFGDGTERVLDSDISQAWPVSDAGLGATSYMLEALSGFMGGRNRWRTMPWMVVMFFMLVVPLGIVSIVLVMLQPIAVGAWCTLCLVTAAAMLIMIAPAIDEVIAMGQFLLAARQEGKPLWRTFWVGGALAAAAHPHAASESDEVSLPRRRVSAKAGEGAHHQHQSMPARILAAMDLTNVPWTLGASVAVGIWVMASPAVFETTGAAANSNYLTGALIVTWAVIAFGEIVRPVRLLNVLMGLWLLAAVWWLGGHADVSRWNDTICGALLIALSIRRGRIDARFGAWNRYLI